VETAIWVWRSRRYCPRIPLHLDNELVKAHVLIALALSSAPLSAGTTVVPCGSEWINIHGENPDLIGIYVRQFPDHKEDRPLYEGKHPALVVYVFSDQRAHQVSYAPSGQARDGFWWDIPEGHSILDEMSTELKRDTICRSASAYDFSRTD